MQAHPHMTVEYRKTLVDTYVTGGKKLSDWNMWVALQTYMQVKELLYFKFGREARLGSHRSPHVPSIETHRHRVILRELLYIAW